MATLILRYIAGFFVLTTIAMTGYSIYLGEVISSLQTDLIKAKNQEVKVVIESTELANNKGKEVQNVINKNEVQKEVTVREIERIVKEPVYLNTCFDTAGLSELSKAISSPIADEPKQ